MASLGYDYFWSADGSNLNVVGSNVSIGTWNTGVNLSQSVPALLQTSNYIPTIFVSNSNVGIGTTAPTARLHVQGNLYVTGNLSSPDGGYATSNYVSRVSVSSASPAFTGTPTAPTATAGTNTTQLATTAFVSTAMTGVATSNYVTTATSNFATSNYVTGATVSKSSNVVGGVGGAVPYQSSENTTAFTAVGTTGQVLTSAGTGVPTWTTATNTNTASAIVQRDANGNFSACNISAGNLGMFRNRIINGDARVNQKGAVADQWKLALSLTSGTVSLGTGSAVPVIGSNLAGFQTAHQLNIINANVSGTSNYIQPEQIIEGLNLSDMMFGTSLAQPFTVSFWIWAQNTATYSVSMRNGSNTRSYVHNYTIAQANAWQYVSFNVPGDTTGTWATDNTAGLVVQFTFGCGSTYQVDQHSLTTNTWVSGTYSGTSATASPVNNIITFTGVQVEKGTIATPFEYRPYAIELQLCQRYYYQMGTFSLGCIGYTYSGAPNIVNVQYTLPVSMRTQPSLTIPSGSSMGNNLIQNTAGNFTAGSIAIQDAGFDNQITLALSGGTISAAANTVSRVKFNHTANGSVGFTAEF